MKLFVGFDAWVLVTPAMAQRWIDAMPPAGVRQRGVSKSRVELYSAARRENRWREAAPEPVILTVSGFPVEGQHRLHMVVRTGMPTRFKVTVIDDQTARDIMPILGTGKQRSHADILRIATGSRQAHREVAIARAILALERGCYVATISPDELAEYIVANRDAIAWALTIKKSKFPACVLGALAFCWAVSPTAVTDFSSKLIDRIGVAPGCPSLALNRRLEGRASAGDKNRYEISMLVVCAVHHFLHNSSIQILKENESARQWFIAQRSRAVDSGRMAAQ